tara:strand:+ start:73 stop:348 length:276 start_codon:yes stop_codon:yes gene_type:complete
MDNLLKELTSTQFSTDDMQKRKEEQRKEWLNSRRNDCGQQGNTKRRRFNPNGHAEIDNSCIVYHSTPVEVAKKHEHSPYVVSGQSDTLSNT